MCVNIITLSGWITLVLFSLTACTGGVTESDDTQDSGEQQSSDGDTDTNSDGDTDTVTDGGSDTDTDGDADTDTDGDADTDTDGDADTDTDGDADTDTDVDTDTDSDGDSDGDADTEGDPERDSDTDDSDTTEIPDTSVECVTSRDCNNSRACCGCVTEFECQGGVCVEFGEICYDAFCCMVGLNCDDNCNAEPMFPEFTGTCGETDCNEVLRSSGHFELFGCCPSGPDIDVCGVDASQLGEDSYHVCLPLVAPDAGE